MEKNQKVNKVELIFDNSNGTPVLSNKDIVLKTLKHNEETPNKKEPIPFVEVKEINDMDGANQWLRPIDYLAIIDENDDKELSDYVKNLERKSEQLYHDLNKIIIEKYDIKDQELIKKIVELNAKNDPIIGKHLDLVDDVIYNVEADWNDALNAANKLDLYDLEIQVGEVSNDEITRTKKFDEVSVNGFKLVEIVAENSEKVDTKQLKSILEQKSSDELYDYINDATAKIKFVEEINKNLIHLYQIISSKKAVKNAHKLGKLFTTLNKNSETVDRVIQTVETSEDFDVRSMFDESFDALDSIETQLEKISKYVKLDEELVNLNEEIITLHKTLDVLTAKLAVAYTIAFDNENKFSKRLIRRNRELESKALKIAEANSNVELVDSNIVENANNEEYKELLAKINEEVDVVAHERFNLFANRKKASKFRSLLDRKLKQLMALNNSKFSTIDAKEYLMNEYFLFLNSELGIVNDLIDLAGLIELQRIKLMGDIAKAEIEFLSLNDLNTKIEFSLQANFEMTKILASEILVLKAILLHRDVISVVKAQAKKQCQELMTVIAWDKRLAWWIDTTKEVVSEAYFHPVYGQDECVQYLFNEISELDLEDEIEEECECEDCEECDDDCECCSSCCEEETKSSCCSQQKSVEQTECPTCNKADQPVKTKTMVMKFIETKYVNEALPPKTMTIKFLREVKVDVEKPIKVVEYNYLTSEQPVAYVEEPKVTVVEKPVVVETIKTETIEKEVTVEKEIKVVTESLKNQQSNPFNNQ